MAALADVEIRVFASLRSDFGSQFLLLLFGEVEGDDGGDECPYVSDRRGGRPKRRRHTEEEAVGPPTQLSVGGPTLSNPTWGASWGGGRDRGASPGRCNGINSSSRGD